MSFPHYLLILGDINNQQNHYNHRLNHHNHPRKSLLKSKSKEQVLQGSDSPKVHWNVKTITETESSSKPNSKSDATKATTEAESQTTPTAMENKPEADQTTKVVLEKQDMEHSEKEEDIVESKPVDDSTSDATLENQSNTIKSMFFLK